MKPSSILLSALALCGGLVSTSVLAQKTKPGLWEITSQMTLSGEAGNAMAQMQAELAKMPPEQRKMMEQMMAQQGLGLAIKPGGATAIRTCLSKEMAERDEVPVQQEGDCKTEMSPRKGNSQRFRFSCSSPPSSGEGEVTHLGPDSYTMKLNMTTVERGKPQQATMNASGKWLGANCGNIKPLR